MSIEAHNRSLPQWFERLRSRQTVLPRFQRFEAWSHTNICQLFNTVLQGLPIGATLVLQVGNDEPFISRPISGAPDVGERVTEHLLDGQQRLTALWRGLHNNYDERTYYLVLNEDEDSGLPYRVESQARWTTNGERRPLWADRPDKLWERGFVPLNLLAPGDETALKLREFLREVIPDADAREMVTDKLNKAKQAFVTYNIPYLSLPVGTSKQTALDVFIKMNTSAEPLSIFDVVVAQVEARMDKSLHELVADAKLASPTMEAYYDPSSLALYAGALMQSKAPIESNYLSQDFGTRLLQNWDKYLLGISRASRFLEEERVFDWQRLPTEVALPVIVALWAMAPEDLDAEGRARTLIRQYFWRANFTNRYERATNSRSLVDFNEMIAYIDGGNNLPAILNPDEYPLPELAELLTYGWPKRKDRLPRALLALSLKKGGLDLADGSQASRENLAKREYHHLFPDAHLQRSQVPVQRINLALNCALVSWRTNRTISDAEPERYLTDRRDATVYGDEEIGQRLASHLIPYEHMRTGDYDTFLLERARLMHEAMLRACNGEPQI